MSIAHDAPLVEMRDIRVSFGGLHAVDGVTVTLRAGEVVAVVGGNGAGKSTLMHTLAGAHPADSGQILIHGAPVTIANPRDARIHGVEVIYQRLALADNIDAAANVFLGRELRTRSGALDDSAMASATRDVMKRLNPRFTNLKTAVRSLSGGQRQRLALARHPLRHHADRHRRRRRSRSHQESHTQPSFGHSHNAGNPVARISPAPVSRCSASARTDRSVLCRSHPKGSR